MKIVRTKIMNLIGKKYMLLFCWLLTAPKANITEADLNHERIHDEQMKELLFLVFYIWYGIEWIVRLIQFWRVGYTAFKYSGLKEALRKLNYMAYRNISFEREAYDNQYDLNYLKSRKRFDFVRYIKKPRV